MKWRYSTRLFGSLGELWLARGDLSKAQGFADLESLLDHSPSTPAAWLATLLDRHRERTAPGLQDDVTALVLQAS